MKPSLDDVDKVTAVTSLRPLDSCTGQDYEKSIAQILDRLLKDREKESRVDKSNRSYVNSHQRARSPSPNPDNLARGYGRKRVSFNDETTPNKYSPKKIICNYCGKFNHTINFCRKKQADNEREQKQKEKSSLE